MTLSKYAAGMSIKQLRQAYLNGDATPEEVVKDIIRRAEEDASMNTWITPPRMERIRPYLDRLADLKMDDAPLWGIPFAIKDNIDWAGVPTTAACPDYQYVPNEHATVVARLIAAGAIPLGKTNLDQFATGLVGIRSPYGETHNALKSELISGGSSSGSAVAVARGHAAFSLGTDTAGSGRVPAALNGIVGYKPSLGAWPTKGVVPACASLDCVSVFALTLDEALIVDKVVRGLDESDPWSRNVPLPVSANPNRMLLPEEPLRFFGPYAQQYEQAWQRTLDKLKKLDIPIQPVSTKVFHQAANLLYGGPFVGERWAGLGSFIEAHPDSVLPVTDQILRTGSAERYDGASVFKAIHALQAYKLEASKLLKDAVLVMPTAGGTWTRDQVRNDPVATNSDMGMYTNHCNLLDLCGVAVPSGIIEDNVPFGITIFALAENEGYAIGAAERFGGALAPARQALAPSPRHTLVAVCGLHMRGLPLEKQMQQCRAKFVREDKTAAKYELYRLPTLPPKPGLVKQEVGGSSIHLEIWEMPLETFGAFAATIPAPLGIGKVELQDGTEVPGFLCEAYVTEVAEDITSFGGWRAVI
ncbi:allophanate hydrolase [Cohnella cholangitidis]|uniref:Allophanate hydrolase n=1 Tax=Cohnella cholangitidis TaxID=2598458 RepID=A0A7G5BYZ1_9BACL|nr:allophanate hydrolase [Cohnella cholangitidis]QMV42175.1 allophanate hydrolase [Cohnella cholangitidis]